MKNLTLLVFAAALTAGSSLAAAGTYDKDIVATAKEAGSFNTLLLAVETAGLTDTLRGQGPFTVFAPTDDAFAKVPPEALAALLADREQLTAVLTHHLVAGKVTSGEVVKLSSAMTVQGTELNISSDGNGVSVSGANVIAVDVAASNGIIHVIDSVLIP